jgi:ABC-type nitrate/sulfonate/bicarbonate transport system permease component
VPGFPLTGKSSLTPASQNQPGGRSGARSSWLAIRAPLFPRRATIAKVASFLLPLLLWAAICFFWVPEVIITDQGDGRFKAGDRVDRAVFDAENARILAARKETTIHQLTDKSFEALRAGGVPEKVLEKLTPLKGNGPTELTFESEKEFLDNLAVTLDKDELARYRGILLQSAEKQEKPLAVGDPSTVIWLPPPHRVAAAFYHAFVTPPVGCGLELTDKSFAALRDELVPKEVRSKNQAILAANACSLVARAQTLQAVGSGPGPYLLGVAEFTIAAPRDEVSKIQSKLQPVKDRFFAYSDRAQFLAELAKYLDQDELKCFQNPILNHAYVRGNDPWLHESLAHSCWIIFLGFIFSAIIGVPLGILCGTFDLFSKVSEPFIDFIRYMPAPAFGVLVVAILGIADGPKIAIIWIGTFFQMVLVVANTTRNFDDSLLEAALTLGATKRSLLTKVILPGILPALYNDMRILLGWAWTYLIVAELIGASSGISFFISQQGRYRHFENVYAGIIMIGVIGLTCDQILAFLARYLFPWVPRKERGSGAWAAFFGAVAWLPRLLVGQAIRSPQPSAPGSAAKT